MTRKISVTYLEVPKGATHYRLPSDGSDEPVWFKTIEVAGVPIWFFLGDHGVWFMAGEIEPNYLNEIGGKND